MKQGDFTLLAKEYIHRPGYSIEVLKAIAKHINALQNPDFVVADIGAGTGKLTENLIELNLVGYAIEPNHSMLEEGMRLIDSPHFEWINGAAENVPLSDSSVDWVLMGSSFHWANQCVALKEFQRILKPGGFFTAIWNPRDIKKNPLHEKIEAEIHRIAPDIKRVSSGRSSCTNNLEKVLLDQNYFENLIFVEAPHEIKMTQDRYLGAWRSVNDIQAQAGPQKFNEILQAIKNAISNYQEICVPYKTRAWTVQSTKVKND